MDLYNNLPIYQLEIDENDDSGLEVNATALVDRPAIKRGFQKFSESRQQFTIAHEERRIVSGPLMIPDMPIYRDDENGKYYITFSEDGIYKVVKKYFRKGFQANFNLMHNASATADGLVMFESFISDSTRGVAPMAGYEDLPDGTWFGSVFVNNDDVWSKIKDGEVKGFSIEGYFKAKVQPVPKTVDQALEEIQKILQQTQF